MRNKFLHPAMALLLLFSCFSCHDTIFEVPRSTAVVEDVQDDGSVSKIYVVDQTDKAWDITHAVQEYGFDPDGFEFGLGPNGIKPILSPQFICRGEPGYPSNDNNIIVIGTELEGEARAYPLTIMRRHEVANDAFGEVHVAVGY